MEHPVGAFVALQPADNPDIPVAMVADIDPEVALNRNRPAADDIHAVDNRYPGAVDRNLVVVADHRRAAEPLVVADTD